MEILALLLLLQLKHYYADFAIQTYMQTVKKGVWLDPVGISHSVDHAYCTLIALFVFSFIHPLEPIIIIAVSLVEALVHYIIDYVKVAYGCKDNTKPLFWNQFGLDQLAHQATYIIIAFFLLIY